jgi:hypothetical protein
MPWVGFEPTIPALLRPRDHYDRRWEDVVEKDIHKRMGNICKPQYSSCVQFPFRTDIYTDDQDCGPRRPIISGVCGRDIL